LAAILLRGAVRFAMAATLLSRRPQTNMVLLRHLLCAWRKANYLPQPLSN